MAIIAKYKFNSTLYADLIPGFNAEFTNYVVTDEATETDSEGNVIKTRVIEHDTLLPTMIRFGVATSDAPTNRELSLLEILELNTTELTNCSRMFIACQNVTSINTEGWTLNKVTNMHTMFYKCNSLTTLDVSNWDTSNVTSMEYMFCYCNNLTTLDVSNFDTKNVTDMSYMFYNCNKLTQLDISNWDTSNVTSMYYMFYYCNNLTSLDVSNWDTINVTNMNSMFNSTSKLQYIRCNNTSTINTLASLLPSRTSSTQGKIITTSSTNIDTTTLSSLNWSVDTSSGTKIAEYVYDKSICNYLIPEFNEGYGGYFVSDKIEDESKPNIVTREIVGYGGLPTLMRLGTNITLDSEYVVGNEKALISVDYLNTDNLTSMNKMFKQCSNLISVNTEGWNTSNVTDMYSAFMYCNSLTSLDVSNWDTSKVIYMIYMFCYCTNLTSLDLSNFNTSNVTSMSSMFRYCTNLTSLDVSNWDTSNVTSMSSMFQNCYKLTQLDVSNFDTDNVTNMDNMFTNTLLLKDIGMLYCSQSTINTLSSNITTPSTNVWVEGGMIDDLTSYDNVTYKAYYWEKEVLLNSPLLEGDKIVKKDGKLYHYHKMGKVVLDGSENWVRSSDVDTDDTKRYSFIINNIKRSGFIICDNIGTSPNYTEIFPHNVVSRIDIKHYYLIDSRWSDVSSLKQWLQENPTTVVYELENPYYELISDTSEDLSLSLLSEDNIISNNSLIPTNMNIKNNGMTTVAMQSSTKYTVAFDKDTDSSVTIDLCGSTIDTTDNVVEITTPSELVNDEITFIGDCEVSNVRILEGSVSGDAMPRESFEGLKSSFEEGKSRGIFDFNGVLVQGKNFNEDTGEIGDNIYSVCCEEYIQVKPNTTYKVYDWGNFGNGVENTRYCFYDKNKIYLGASSTSRSTTPENCTYIRLCFTINDNYDIEKAQIQLEEGAIATEYIPYGKYKVEYKVTGKNKFDGDSTMDGYILTHEGEPNINASWFCTDYIRVDAGSYYIGKYKRPFDNFYCYFYDLNKNYIARGEDAGFKHDISTFSQSGYIRLCGELEYKDVGQLVYSTVATEYEPYKSYTKTFYLNSPLLEGDTIEDVNGVATHVKRYEKVVLDGSKEGVLQLTTSITNKYRFKINIENIVKATTSQDVFPIFCDKYVAKSLDETWFNHNCIAIDTNSGLTIYDENLQTLSSFKQWFSENPTTVVYKLASPIYEPISTESILCDSYVNGHLDVDSNIPIEKVKFMNIYNSLKYIIPNTRYIIQFESDSVGKLDIISLCNYWVATNKNVIKGTNRFEVYSDSNSVGAHISLVGIGFNASNIQVVATDRDNIGYFKGIQSSFEDKVIRNKNLFNKNNIVLNCEFDIDNGTMNTSSTYHSTEYIECKPNTHYTCNTGTFIHYFDENKVWIGCINYETPSPFNAKYLVKCIGQTVDLDMVQIEEGTQKTEYEPYKKGYAVEVSMVGKNKETGETIYLNSPLLKGDKIEMYNGKLCHYHKMGKVVLDGSDSLNIKASGFNSSTTTCKRYYISQIDNNWFDAPKCYPSSSASADVLAAIYCDKIPTIYSFITVGMDEYNGLGISLYVHNDYNNPLNKQFRFIVPSSIGETVEDFKQWLQANPITVVYELAEPYYEDITPIQNEFVVTSIGESSFTIDSGAIPTDGEITYSVNVKLLNDLEESINNNTSSTDTDLSTILDDIINE